ncbi:MAG: transketolase [Anaerolineaceae bacterium]|nr:transketolase [Anaerolineaceae bacterium]
MPLDLATHIALEEKASFLRHDIVNTTYSAGSGHLGGALSVIDVATLLYYHVMRIDRNNPGWEDRDRFILSKGHAGIGFVSILADLGFIPHDELKSFNLTGSRLGIHLDSTKVPGVDASTGSLGHGLSIALGIALAAKQLKKDFRTFCVLGDGECDEGAVWEAAMAIPNFKASNLITFVDRNHCMIDGNTENVMKLEPFQQKWEAFGFFTETVDGHDFSAMNDAIERALARTEQPTCIILNTMKGNGVDFACGDYRWHYGAINDELLEKAHQSLDAYHAQRMAAIQGA